MPGAREIGSGEMIDTRVASSGMPRFYFSTSTLTPALDPRVRL
jgi:hypothetical protein